MTIQEAANDALYIGGFIRRKRKKEPVFSVYMTEDLVTRFQTVDSFTLDDLTANDWFVPDKTPL